MNKKFLTIFITLVVLVFILAAMGPFYILEEGQQAVLIRFGKIIDTQQDAGLKLKVPFIDNVVKYSKKLLTWDGNPQRIPTKENLFIWVDTTARWEITDPAKFYASVTYMESAFGRLDEVIDSSIRTIISKNTLREAVRNSNIINELEKTASIMPDITEGEESSMQQEVKELSSMSSDSSFVVIEKGREKLSQEVFDAASAITPQFGIRLVDIIVRQIRYSDDLTESVYNRMIKDRNQVAQAFRSFGEGKKAEWLGKLQNEQKTILSQAYKTSEEIKGKADAEATKIYASAYSKDPDFFEFWRSIESYRKTMTKFNKVLTTDMEYFKYLNEKSPR
ncbi:MAG: protease modulator HflC [Spirochaetia bacterium]|jgi:membrane protease subunit HflC|nr:protease modulator HflC [Spirochaetia bacterium]